MEVKPGYKQTEVGVIPDDWYDARIGEIASIQVGRDLREECFSRIRDSSYRYPVFSNTVDHLGLYGFYSVPEYNGDSVTVVGRGVGLGTAFARSGGYGAIGRLIVLFPDARVDSSFLTAYINQRVTIFHESGGIPQLTGIQIAKYRIAVPPIREQRAIAGALSDVDALIGTLNQLIAKKRDLKQAAMQQLLTGKKRLPGFHGEWEVKRLGEIAMLYQPITISAKQFVESGYPVYGANGVVGFYHDFNHDRWQITVTCRGSTCGTVNRTVEKCWITGNAMVVNCDQNKDLNKDFLYYVLLSQDLSVCITGTGQPQIVRGPLANVELSIPSGKTSLKLQILYKPQ